TLDCSGADKQHAHCKGRTGQVTVYGTLGTRSAVIFDADNDGALDIITNELNAAPQVFMSDLPARRKIHWLKIHPVAQRPAAVLRPRGRGGGGTDRGALAVGPGADSPRADRRQPAAGRRRGSRPRRGGRGRRQRRKLM